MTHAPMSPPPPTTTAGAIEAKQKASETFARTSALMQSDDFAWFIGAAVEAEIFAQVETALSLASNDRDRDRAAHTHETLCRLRGWVEESHRNAKTIVNP